MFEKFNREFSITNREENCSITPNFISMKNNVLGAEEFINRYSGATFNNGLYRVHNINDIAKWTGITIKAFPNYSNRIECFGYDWLGRQFAMDYQRLDNNEPMILMLEIGTGEILEIPATLLTFHEVELIEYMDSALAVNFFNDWLKKSRAVLKHSQCVGYKVPLFLGGRDSVENLEVSDMEVYWGIFSQLFN